MPDKIRSYVSRTSPLTPETPPAPIGPMMSYGITPYVPKTATSPPDPSGSSADDSVYEPVERLVPRPNPFLEPDRFRAERYYVLDRGCLPPGGFDRVTTRPEFPLSRNW
jgi:hypothetical protein